MRSEDYIEWFKENILSNLPNQDDWQFRYFSEGDLGALSQILFDNENIGIAIDFWDQNYLGILVYDYKNDCVIIDRLLDSEQEIEKKNILAQIPNFF